MNIFPMNDFRSKALEYPYDNGDRLLLIRSRIKTKIKEGINAV
jgi:hypothetical protein